MHLDTRAVELVLEGHSPAERLAGACHVLRGLGQHRFDGAEEPQVGSYESCFPFCHCYQGYLAYVAQLFADPRCREIRLARPRRGLAAILLSLTLEIVPRDSSVDPSVHTYDTIASPSSGS